jgi:hypothetical protein
MKNFRSVFFISTLVLLLAFANCTEQVKPTPYTYSKILTGEANKVWAIEKVLQRKTGTDDQTISLSNCEKDDRYTFYANDERLFEVTNGLLKCADENDMLVSYNWSLNNATATLTMVVPHVFGNFIIPFIVTKAEKNSMVLEVFADANNTISYVLYFKLIDEN